MISADEAVAAVAVGLAGRTGTRWVGVDGKGGSGKSTLAGRIASVLPGAVVVHVDDFARPDVPGWEQERFVEQVAAPLLAGHPAHYQRWDWGTNSGAEWHEISPGRPVVVEGVSATDGRLGVPWDVTLWVAAPRALRLQRALARDGKAMMERWLTDWMPSEDAYVRAQRPQDRVDLIVDGSGGHPDAGCGRSEQPGRSVG